MSFGISNSVMSRVVQVCTPELFHQATRSSVVKDVCSQIADALESKRRGEMNNEDFETLKTQLKKRLPILTPHATFRNGRRCNSDAIPSGFSIYDIDHIPNPRGYWEEKKKLLAEKKLEVVSGALQSPASKEPASSKQIISVLDLIVLVHVTPSSEGLRLVFIIPDGMSLADAQKWMSQQLGDEEYDVCVKDLARPSFIVPEDYILFINNEELFKDRKFTFNNSITNSDVQDNRLPGTHSHPAVSSGSAIQPAQSGDSNGTAAGYLSPAGAHPDACQEIFPTEYQGIPYYQLIRKLIELLGGEPEHGSRNSFIFTLTCYLRYLCDDNPTWIKQIIPTFGEDQKRAFTTVESACSRKQSHRMPSIVRTAIKLAQEADSKAKGEGSYDDEDFGDIHNPESYFYNIHQMPQKLPKLIKLLISKTPSVYRPAVSQAVFPPLASHLLETRFRYIDNIEHEATLSSILCAPTGSGKEAITQPINRIMADIRRRDAEQRERERKWKDECNSKGANKDRRERPEGLVIQEVNIDMTNPAFVLRMKEAANHFLYAKVNELNLFDALKGKTNQHFRIMELAFDLGTYGQDRVGTQSVTETVKVRFNWNACCTPKKCRDYFRKVVTDGPISRISFATIERRPCGSDIPVYGTYDAAFDEELKPYVDNLLKARGLVNCPQAMRLAKTLVEENAEFSRLSQNRIYENFTFRGNVIGYLKACVLYVANGFRWEPEIEEFIRWSEQYDLYCKMRFFEDGIKTASMSAEKSTSHGPSNLLQQLPDEFMYQQAVEVRQKNGLSADGTKNMLYAWVHRGYIERRKAGNKGGAAGGTSGGTSDGSYSSYSSYSSDCFIKLKFRKDGVVIES